MVLENFVSEKFVVRQNALEKVSYNHILNHKMWLELQHFENEGALKTVANELFTKQEKSWYTEGINKLVIFCVFFCFFLFFFDFS